NAPSRNSRTSASMASVVPATVPLIPSWASRTVPLMDSPAHSARSGSRSSRKSGSGANWYKAATLSMARVYQPALRCETHAWPRRVPRGSSHCSGAFGMPRKRRAVPMFGPQKNDKERPFGMRNFHLAGRSTVHALNGMVATSHPLAALTAIEVLKEGGTAADAAVAACALLGVIEPQSTGIGGDCFALVQPKGEGKIVSYNGSGRAPKAATAEWYMEHKMYAIPTTGVHSVSVPGAIDAWATILRDHGKFGLDRLLQPAIKAAEEGYVVAPRIAFDWRNGFEKLRNG